MTTQSDAKKKTPREIDYLAVNVPPSQDALQKAVAKAPRPVVENA